MSAEVMTPGDLLAAVQLLNGQASHQSTDAAEAKDYFRTDVGNAQRFADRQKAELVWVSGVGWHSWSGSRWERADETLVIGRSMDVARELYDVAKHAREEDRTAATRHALASQSRARIEAAMFLARGDLLIAADKLDRDPWLLNCRNGTIDLRTGVIRAHRREDYLTRLAPLDFNAAAVCPLWEAFLARVVPSADVRAFLQRAVGYSLSGDVSAQVLFFLFGKGANGKSVFASVMQTLLGDYASAGAPELLVEHNHEGHPTDLAALWGRRAVVCSETEQGNRLAESRVKALTGGDTIKARFMRQDFFDFTPTHKLWLLGNHQLRVRSSDHAIWRRILEVPFEQTIPQAERDPGLVAKLCAEAPGIGAWAVRGCLDWQAHGLEPPREVTEATAAYRESQDHVGTFLADACRLGENERCASVDLYGAYSAWCDSGGERRWTMTALGLALRDRGFARWNNGTKKGWQGLSPKLTSLDGSSVLPRVEHSYGEIWKTRQYPSRERNHYEKIDD